jgi:HEAT repeat protein
MELESLPQQTLQPTLFEYGGASTGAMELFPAVWIATEALLSPEFAIRQQGLTRLNELSAPRLSPLVVGVLATRITEPDLELRRQIVYTLGNIFVRDEMGRPAPEAVRQTLAYALKQMRQRPLYALLEVAVIDPMAAMPISRLINACPYAGRHMADILLDRKYPLAIRRMAVHFIGTVGYLEAIPALEKMLARLEARVIGQHSMPFAPPSQPDEVDLLPEIRAALASLRAP